MAHPRLLWVEVTPPGVVVTSVIESATNMVARTYARAPGHSGSEDILLKISKLSLQNDAEVACEQAQREERRKGKERACMRGLDFTIPPL